MSNKQNQHSVSISHIKQFSPYGGKKVNAFLMKQNKYLSGVNPVNLMNTTNAWSKELETAWGDIESEAGNALKRIRQFGCLPLSHTAEWMTVLKYIALHKYRNPLTLQLLDISLEYDYYNPRLDTVKDGDLESLQSYLTDVYGDKHGFSIEEIHKIISSKGRKHSSSQSLMDKTLLELVQSEANKFKSLKWCLFKTSAPHYFVLSDSPVTLSYHENLYGPAGPEEVYKIAQSESWTGYRSVYVTFPLSSELVLMGFVYDFMKSHVPDNLTELLSIVGDEIISYALPIQDQGFIGFINNRICAHEDPVVISKLSHFIIQEEDKLIEYKGCTDGTIQSTVIQTLSFKKNIYRA